MNGVKNNLNFINLLIFLLLFSIFILPSFYIREYFPKIRLEDLLLFFVFLIILYNFRFDKNIQFYLFIIFIFLIWILITILYNLNNMNLNGIYEIYKVIKYILIFCFFYKYCSIEYRFIKLINFIFILVIIFNFFQLYNIGNVNVYILKYYTGDIIYNTFINQFSKYSYVKRLIGTMGNPNNNAILISFFVIFYFNNFKIRKRFIYFIFLLISLSFFLLCNSRTTLIGLIFSFLFYFVLTNKNTLKLIIILFLLFLFLIAVQKIEKLEYLSTIFTVPFTENTSLLKRFEVWNYLFDMIKDRFIFGYGPDKNFFYSNHLYSENEYILMFWRYGLPGAILYLLELFIPLYQAIRNKNKYFSNIVFMFSIVICVCAFTNNPMSEPRINIIHAIISSLMFSEIKKNNEVINNVQIATC